jgi:hypothetical protein
MGLNDTFFPSRGVCWRPCLYIRKIGGLMFKLYVVVHGEVVDGKRMRASKLLKLKVPTLPNPIF